jgi:hypothetical protein
MSYDNWSPEKLGVDLAPLTDFERRIVDPQNQSRSIWNLALVQAGLRSQELVLKITPFAQSEMLSTLNWMPDDLENFLCCIYPGRYEGSQWCYPQGSKFDIACDAYVMGFDRIKNLENQRTTRAYVKFSIVKTSIYVVSAHAEKPKKER